MDSNITIYRPKKSVIAGGLIVLAITLLLTISTFTSRIPVSLGQLEGLAGFWLLGIASITLPFGFTLEIGPDYMATYFLGLRINKLYASDVQSLKYGNIFGFGGLGAGKGLRIWKQTPKGRRYVSVGESMYGKDAIAHAKRVLGRKL